jgi:hypothetical protein
LDDLIIDSTQGRSKSGRSVIENGVKLLSRIEGNFFANCPIKYGQKEENNLNRKNNNSQRLFYLIG